MLKLDKVSKTYKTGDKALQNACFEVPAGQVVGLIGPSGAGKSTLIRCINRLVEPTAGSITLGDTEMTGLNRKQLRRARRRIGMIFQEYALVERLTVMENVLSGRLGYVPVWRSCFRKYSPDDIALAFSLLDKVGLADQYNKRADALSGGQRQRVGKESLTMTLTSTVAGILISVPIGIGAARNLAPVPVFLACRGIITVSRSFQEVIIAILLVAMFGFGPLAGFLTLAFATIGFLSKLLAEEIEDCDHSQIEAVRATGASWWQVVNYAVQPQVMPRLLGLSLYRLDINFRESAVIGIVGAGGIGATLNTAIDRYEYDSAGAILLIIIGIVLVVEYSSSYIRRWVQ